MGRGRRGCGQANCDTLRGELGRLDEEHGGGARSSVRGVAFEYNFRRSRSVREGGGRDGMSEKTPA